MSSYGDHDEGDSGYDHDGGDDDSAGDNDGDYNCHIYDDINHVDQNCDSIYASDWVDFNGR